METEFLQFVQKITGYHADAPPQLPEIILAIGLSFGLNLLIAAVYKATYRGAGLSQDYIHSLLILGTVVSVVVMVVQTNKEHAQATAFGIFAAFSIIRFRTALNQARDIGFIFLAMAAGLGVGARAYTLATATTILLCVIVYGFSKLDLFAPARASHRLRIRVTNDTNYDVVFAPCFDRYLYDFDLISLESIQAGMMTELRYNVHLKDKQKLGEFVAAVQQINGNNHVLLTSAASGRVLAD